LQRGVTHSHEESRLSHEESQAHWVRGAAHSEELPTFMRGPPTYEVSRRSGRMPILGGAAHSCEVSRLPGEGSSCEEVPMV
jgi:hypothetical protein